MRSVYSYGDWVQEYFINKATKGNMFQYLFTQDTFQQKKLFTKKSYLKK